MRIKLFTIIILAITSCAFLNAQIVIQGKVTDKENSPLPGAAIMLTGTNYGTSSDLDGKYTLEIKKLPAGANTIEVKFVGYKNIKETLPKTSGHIDMNFVLREDILQLDQCSRNG